MDRRPSPARTRGQPCNDCREGCCRPRRPRTFGRARLGAGLSGAIGHHRGTVRARRHVQRARPADRRQARAALRQIVHRREPTGRELGDRLGVRRARGAGRLHPHDGRQHDPGDQRLAAQESALQSAHRLRPDRADRPVARGAAGQCGAAGAFDRGPGQARARDPRRTVVRFGRARHRPAPQRRAVQDDAGYPDAAHPLQGHAACAQRSRRRAYRDDDVADPARACRSCTAARCACSA